MKAGDTINGIVVKSVEKKEIKGVKRSFAACTCHCSNEFTCQVYDLASGATKSCGCLQKLAARKQGLKNRKHGLRQHRLYNSWSHMHRRCREHPAYEGRGITVCEEWTEFEPFYNWAMSNGWKIGLSIERLNNAGDYAPKNCMWATKIQQNNNTRKNVKVTIFGETKTIAQWSRDNRCVVTYDTLDARIRQKWEPELAIACPANVFSSYEAAKKYFKP